MLGDNLTAKQLLFCKYIKLGMVQSAAYKKAGYKGTGNTAEVNSTRLLRNAKIVDYMALLGQKIEKNTIASIAEVQEYWTGYIRQSGEDEEDVAPKDRLKASELLVKSKGGFIDKIEAKEEVTIKLGGELDDLAK